MSLNFHSFLFIFIRFQRDVKLQHVDHFLRSTCITFRYFSIAQLSPMKLTNGKEKKNGIIKLSIVDRYISLLSFSTIKYRDTSVRSCKNNFKEESIPFDERFTNISRIFHRRQRCRKSGRKGRANGGGLEISPFGCQLEQLCSKIIDHRATTVSRKAANAESANRLVDRL